MTAGLQPGAQGFDPGASAYERSRPSYPPEAVSCMVEHLEQSERDELLGRVRDLVAGFAEPFVLPYRTAVYWCSKSS